MTHQLATIIDAAWDTREGISSTTKGEVRDAVQTALAGLDDGSYRVAEKLAGSWQVHQWLKKAVLLSFRLNDNILVDGGASGAPAYDKVGMLNVSAMQVSALCPGPSPDMAAMSAKTSC